jgi:cyclase
LHHPGHAAHTTGDLVAWLPRQRVLYTGDLLFHQVTPLVFMGSAEGALRALDWIAAFDPDHVIPGHGPLIGRAELPAALDVHRRYYNLVISAAHAGIRDGLSPLDTAIRCDLGQFAALPDAERIVLNLHRAHADITGATTDMIKAFTDTVTYNGGPMHTIV